MAPPRGCGAEEEERPMSEMLTADSANYGYGRRRGSSSSSETESTVSFSYSPPAVEWQPVAIKTCVSADVTKTVVGTEDKPVALRGGDDNAKEKHRASGTYAANFLFTFRLGKFRSSSVSAVMFNI
jgi:hypothetical protein